MQRQVRVGGYPVPFRVVGEGTPAVLVHGLSGSARWWEPIVPALARAHSVHLLDLPGFGRGRRARGRFEHAGAAAWLGEWMDAAGIERAHLVGHSLGGLICLRLAALRPDLVDRVVAIAPPGVRDTSNPLRYVPRLTRTVVAGGRALLPVLVRDALHAGPLTLARTAWTILRDDVGKELELVGAPTLLVWGADDRLIPPAMAEVFRSRLRDARVLLVDRAGHVPMLEQPKTVATAVATFLAGSPVGD